MNHCAPTPRSEDDLVGPASHWTSSPALSTTPGPIPPPLLREYPADPKSRPREDDIPWRGESSNDFVYRFPLTTHHRTNIMIVHLGEKLTAAQRCIVVVLDVPLPQLALDKNGFRKALLLEKALCILISICQHKPDTILQVFL